MTMSIESAIRIMAGAMVLLSLALGAEASPIFLSKHWLWLTAFVGANLVQSGFTGFCPPTFLLKRMGFSEGGTACRAR